MSVSGLISGFGLISEGIPEINASVIRRVRSPDLPVPVVLAKAMSNLLQSLK